MLALSQSLPSYEASVSPSLNGSFSFTADSLASNQAQSFSSSLSFSETLAGLQAENPSRSSAPVSFPPSPLLQSGTHSYSTPSYSTQSSNQDADGSPFAPDNGQSVQALPSDKNRSAQASSADDNRSVQTSSTDGTSSSVQAPATDRELKSSTAAQEPAENGTKTDQGVKRNPSSASSSMAQTGQKSTSTDASSSSPTPDPTAISPDLGRSPSELSTSTQRTAAGTKASDTVRQEVGKRHRKANEAAPAGVADGAKSDSVAATLLVAANSSATAATNGGESAAAASVSSAGASAVTNKNNLTAASNSPNALAFAVKLQSASSAVGGSAADSAAHTPAEAPPTGDSSGSEGFSKFAQQMQAVSGAAQLTQEPAAVHDPTGLAVMPGTTGFATSTNAGVAQPSSSTETNTPQTTETDGADADTSARLPVPLRSMQVQINGQDNQRVDLRLVERAGTLSMSVRSLDSTLNRNLQDHLPELMTKLADQPGQAEWWTPKTQPAAGGNGSSNGDGSKEDSSGSQGQQSQSGQDSGKQSGGRQSNQPKWVEELAALGNSNKTRKETIWHQ